MSALNQGESLYSSFQSARWAVQAAQPFQTPWLDDNGDGTSNSADGQEAQRRGFSYAGTFRPDDNWPPYITQVITPITVAKGHGVIRANVLDDDLVGHVWAVIYPPSYRPPATGEQIVSEALPTIMLLNQGNDSYAAAYTGFDEVGVYRVVVYADDNTGVEARPVAIEVRTGWKVFLPLVRKSN